MNDELLERVVESLEMYASKSERLATQIEFMRSDIQEIVEDRKLTKQRIMARVRMVEESQQKQAGFIRGTMWTFGLTFSAIIMMASYIFMGFDAKLDEAHKAIHRHKGK